MRDLFNLKRKEFKLPLLQWPAFLILSFVMLVGQAPAAAQTPASGITEPASGDTVSGVVVVQGTAVHPDFLRYELAFWQESNPEAGWIVFAEGSQEVGNLVANGTLAVWDTTVGRDIGAPVFPDGRYQLRLRVVKEDYNYDEYFVTNLTVATGQPTPTATSSPTTTATAAPVEGTSTAPEVTSSFQQPTPLPSLTPFPTPTPPATPAGVAGPGAREGGGGVLGALAAVETGRFSQAFWQGALLTGAAFAAMALYLLLRAAGRRLWRLIWTRLRRSQAAGEDQAAELKGGTQETT